MRPVANEGEEFMNNISGLSKADHKKSALTEELQATLWRCGKCNSFIAIHSQYPVLQAICPICIDGTIEFCGPLPAILELPFADA
jgi:hypothetical protein